MFSKSGSKIQKTILIKTRAEPKLDSLDTDPSFGRKKQFVENNFIFLFEFDDFSTTETEFTLVAFQL